MPPYKTKVTFTDIIPDAAYGVISVEPSTATTAYADTYPINRTYVFPAKLHSIVSVKTPTGPVLGEIIQYSVDDSGTYMNVRGMYDPPFDEWYPCTEYGTGKTVQDAHELAH